nr:SGNH/GDSL hydrolase family protein [Specibacter cremeus]
MEFAARYVALGDSFTEGVGDVDPALPNRVRGWADRLAGQLAATRDGFGYANLAVRGKKMRQILAEQIEPALALEPTLVTVYAGVNDLLRPRVDIDAMVAAYDDAVARLAATGATVLLFTGFDASASKVFRGVRGRTAVYNELVREVADRHGAQLVDYWRFDEYNDWRMWDVDRMHMSTPGHVNMANRVLEALGEEARLPLPPLPAAPARTRLDGWRDNARWARSYAGPWVGRRLRGVSSGDNLAPRWPDLHAPAGPGH